MQRLDSALRLNVHLLCFRLTGVYVQDALTFLHLHEPTADEVARVAHRTRHPRDGSCFAIVNHELRSPSTFENDGPIEIPRGSYLVMPSKTPVPSMFTKFHLVALSIVATAAMATGACSDDTSNNSGGGGSGASSGCPSGQTECGGECAELNANAEHCGACDVACGPEDLCVAGQCQPISEGCPAGQQQCAGACVELQTSTAHCGSCGNRCAVGQTCTAGECTGGDQGSGGSGGTGGSGTSGSGNGPSTGGQPPIPTGGWNEVASPSVVSATVNAAEPAIAVGSDETPVVVIAKQDTTANNNGPLVFQRLDGSQWKQAAPSLNVYNKQNGEPEAADLGVDANGRLIVLFAERIGSGVCNARVLARRLQGGVWASLGRELSGGLCTSVSMALDGNDIYGMWSGDTAFVKRYSDSGGSWQSLSGSGNGAVPKCPGGLAPPGMGAVALLDGSIPAVVWGDRTKDKKNFCAQKWAGSNWSVISDWSPNPGPFSPPITVTAVADGSSLVALGTGNTEAWSFRYTSGTPTLMGDTVEDAGNTRVLLRTPAGGLIRVLGGSGGVVASSWDGSTWQQVGDPLPAVSRCTDGAVSPAGVPWVVCLEGASSVRVFKLED